MSGKLQTLCDNTQSELLAETPLDGSVRQKESICPYCIFFIGAHKKGAQLQASVTSSPSAKRPNSGSAKEGRDYGSFRKRVLRRERVDPTNLPPLIQCQICGDQTLSLNIQAAHIVDLGQRELLFAKVLGDVNSSGIVFPSSINDQQNGVLACTECHPLFDSKDKHIRMDPTGLLLFDEYSLNKSKYKTLQKDKAKVLFAAKIDVHPAYPSSAYLKWALQQQKCGRSGVVRKLTLESDEESDEDPPKKKAQPRKKQKTSQSKTLAASASPSTASSPNWKCIICSYENRGDQPRCAATPAAASGEIVCRGRRPH